MSRALYKFQDLIQNINQMSFWYAFSVLIEWKGGCSLDLKSLGSGPHIRCTQQKPMDDIP